MMRDDFCAFILTHGRADRVHTYKTLRKAGYTGKIYLVIDDEDDQADKYKQRYGDEVLQFCKREVARWTDDGDNFGYRKSVIYARNVCWELARQIGCKYFIQLDDDYTNFIIRHDSNLRYHSGIIKRTLDDAFSVFVEFYKTIPALTIAWSQGGDQLGGKNSQGNPSLRRKCMNTFICSVDRPFQFFGRINEDVNVYTTLGRRGDLFFTVIQAQVNQLQTQANAGGWTEHYLEVGTYVKTFYSVMYSPSCVKVGIMGDHRSPHYRIHHQINWNKTAPKILNEKHKKTEAKT